MRKVISSILFIAALIIGFVVYDGVRRSPWLSIAEAVSLFGFAAFLFVVGLIIRPNRERKTDTYFNTKNDRFRDREFDAMTGAAHRPSELPAWFCSLRSPFADEQDVTSWFGGLPAMPPDAQWPIDADGKRMHFVLQIDLSDLTGAIPANLTIRGAMLLFVSFKRGGGENTYKVLQLTEEELRGAVTRKAPRDLAPLADVGFFDGEGTFPHWPIDLHYRLDNGDELASNELSAEKWIINWGTALAEAKALKARLEIDAYQRKQFDEWMSTRDADSPPLKPFQEKQERHHAAMRRLGPTFHAALDAFMVRAENMPPDAPIDQENLKGLLQRRRDLAEHPDTYQIEGALTPRRSSFIYNQLRLRYKDGTWRFQPDALDEQTPHPELKELPAHFQHVVSGFIADTQFHGLFGRTLPPTSEPIELRGMDSLVMLPANKLLGTQTDHEDGFSIWCPSADMAEGNFLSGKLVWHTNV